MADVLVAPKTNAGRQRLVGKVWARIVLSNRGDEVLVERGYADAGSVRALTLDHVLVDTGTTNLCLPRDVVIALGVPFSREVQVDTATGTTTARIFKDVVLNVEGRYGTFECLEMPGGTQPLLGVIPLEALGINLDLANERMELLPDWGDDTYLTIL